LVRRRLATASVLGRRRLVAKLTAFPHPSEVALPQCAADATITKMIKAFGAPIDDADAKAIADYFKKNYGV
jgi:hypothetical protein